MRMGDDSNDDDDDDYDSDGDDDSDDDDGVANGEGLAGSQRCRQAVCSLLLTNPIAVHSNAMFNAQHSAGYALWHCFI